MISFRNLIFVICILIASSIVNADNHDTEQNIVEKAKEINKKVKEQQALQSSNIDSEIGKEEPLPLNDPFVGDGSLGSGSTLKLVADTEEEKKNLSIFNYKLVGIIEGEDEGYASLVDENGEIINIGFYEELSPGIRLISISSKEIVFERGEDSLVAINFKNQVIERNK
ncbi:MAG: pilus assembly protein PilP [Candidatus Pelagibacter sp.]|nr:pilus assembly protein PilP [Candidatus Pelagibacter sp.]